MRLFKKAGQRSRPRSLQKAGAKVAEHRLDNGMRVLIAERHSDPVVAVLLFYGVGARNESEREAGVSHFLEHMMFKGTPAIGKGEVDRITTELGGQNNAFTGYDHTAYWFEFASDRWETALDIEVDRMKNLALDPAEFASERAVVLEELAGGEDDPWRVLARHVEDKLFPRHPYARPIIGFPDTLHAMTPESMRDYYERFYHPGNATLVLCGDVKPKAALEAVRARFGSLPAGKPFAEADCPRPPLEEPPGEVRLETRWDDASRRLVMAWRTERVGSEADYALDLALGTLTGGRMGRLQRRLVLDGSFATSVSISNDTRVDSGAFWLFAECAQGVDPAVLEQEIDDELRKLATTKLDAREMKRVRSFLRSSEAYDGETVSDLAEELGEYAVDYDWREAFDGGARHDQITPTMLRDTVARLLVPSRRVVGWCLPLAEEEAVAPPKKAKRRKKVRRS